MQSFFLVIDGCVVGVRAELLGFAKLLLKSPDTRPEFYPLFKLNNVFCKGVTIENSRIVVIINLFIQQIFIEYLVCARWPLGLCWPIEI